jgi:hypothetical protein
MNQEQKKQYKDITGIDPDELSKSYMKTIAVELHKAGMLYYFVAAISSEESLDKKESCDFAVQSLRDLKAALDEVDIMELNEREKLKVLIDETIQHCYDVQKELKE